MNKSLNIEIKNIDNNILTNHQLRESKLESNKASPFPFKVTWDITHRCNLRCSHCFVIFQNNREGTTSEKIHYDIANSILSAHPFILSIAGGEPFLIPYIEKIIDIFIAQDIRVIVATNGTIDNDLAMRKFIASGKVSMQVSIDGASMATHDSIRGIGNFQKTVTFIKKYSDKIPMLIAITLTKDVCLDLKNIFSLALDCNVKVIKFQKFVVTKSVPDKELSPTSIELDIARDYILNETRINHEVLILHPFTEKHDNRNAIGLRECTITPKGNLSLCGAVLDECGLHGNVIEKNLINLWAEFIEKRLSVNGIQGDCLCSL